jgi:beta-glucanase (GH16 family)
MSLKKNTAGSNCTFSGLRSVRSNFWSWGLVLLWFFTSAGTQAWAVVSLPYTNSFDADMTGPWYEDPNFLTSSTFGYAYNYWQVVAPGVGGTGNGYLSVTTNSVGTIYNAATVQSFIPAPLPLYMSGDFQIQATNTSGNSYIGLAAYGNQGALGVVGNATGQGTFIWPFLQVAGSGQGSLGWVNFINGSGNNAGITINNQVGGNLPINTNDIYYLALTGTYDASTNLTLVLTVTDENTSASASRSEVVSWAVLAANFTGSTFGIVNRDNTLNPGVQKVLLDNFSLSSSITTNYLVDASRSENLAGWSLAFNDEFNGSQLNTNKWDTTYMWGGNSARTLPGNDEMEVYLDNQFVETNGVLRIRGDKLDSVWYGSTYHYASGLIDTYQKFSQPYGYFEMRAQLPHGNSLWPAFWMMYNYPYWPPEVDILEVLDSEEEEPHQGGIQNGSGSYFGQFTTAFNTTLAYHVYSLEWNPQYLTYYLDGQQIAQTHVPTNQPAPMQILANLAIGGLGTIPPDATTVFPAYMNIDYIRVWTRTNSAAPIPYMAGYDIGNVGTSGNTSVNTNGTAVVSGAGLGYASGANSDSFQFAAQPMPGDVDYDYQIEISSASMANGQAGVMIRQTLDPASPYAAIYFSGGNCVLQSRTSYGTAATQTTSVPALASANLWLRLYRRGDAFTAYQSLDGISWNYIAAVTNDMSGTIMGSSVFAGAAVSSGSSSSLNTISLGSLNNPAVQIIQDVASPTGVTLTGPWVFQNSADNGGTGGYYGPAYYSDNKTNKGKCTALFVPTIPSSAYYDVYMYWLSSPHAASNTPVVINYQGGTAQLTVNQQHQGGEWVYVGTFPFAAGSSGSLMLTNVVSTTGFGVIANAVRLVPGVATPPASPTVPPAPTGLTLTCTPDKNQVGLQWNPVPEATSYNIKRAMTSGGPYANIVTGVITSSPYFTDSNVVAGTTYYYVVTAVNDTSPSNPGGEESAYSSQITGMPSTIVANTNATGVTITGAWTTATATIGYYGASYLQDGDAGGGESVRFTPSLPVTGYYDVFMRWTSETNHATNAPVDIDYNGGTNTVYVNQQISDGVWWVYLGTYNFTAGANNSVLVRDDGASGQVIANAIEFVPDTQKTMQVSPSSVGAGFNISSFAGSNYQLQRSSSLSPTAWQNVGSPQPGDAGSVKLSDPGSVSNQAGFYRVQISP